MMERRDFFQKAGGGVAGAAVLSAWSRIERVFAAQLAELGVPSDGQNFSSDFCGSPLSRPSTKTSGGSDGAPRLESGSGSFPLCGDRKGFQFKTTCPVSPENVCCLLH